MRHRRRPNTQDDQAPETPGRTKPNQATAAFLAIMLALGSLLMGCELLDNLGAGTGTGAGTGAAGGAVLPTTTALLEEARRLGHSPFDVLKRRYQLKRDAIKVKYDREIRTIERKLAGGVITSAQADPQKKLAELNKARELATLDAVNNQRKEELEELSKVIRQ